jgi:hypothetical protein
VQCCSGTASNTISEWDQAVNTFDAARPHPRDHTDADLDDEGETGDIKKEKIIDDDRERQKYKKLWRKEDIHDKGYRQIIKIRINGETKTRKNKLKLRKKYKQTPRLDQSVKAEGNIKWESVKGEWGIRGGGDEIYGKKLR